MTSAHQPKSPVMDTPHALLRSDGSHSPYAVRCLPPFTLRQVTYVDRVPSKLIRVAGIPLGSHPCTVGIIEGILSQLQQQFPDYFSSPLSVQFQVDRIEKVKEGQPCHRLRFHDPALVDKFLPYLVELRLLLVGDVVPKLGFDVVRSDDVRNNEHAALIIPLLFEREVKIGKRPRSDADS